MKSSQKKRRGFTLVEIIIALVLCSMVSGLAVTVVNLVTKGYLGTNMETTVLREDSNFAFEVNEKIKSSGTAFTMPKKSFRRNNLTPRWSYLGILEGIDIPKEASLTGKEETNKNALVYAEYLPSANKPPAQAGYLIWAANKSDTNPAGNQCNDGWFRVRIFGHDFTDHNDITHTYGLKFLPVDGKEANREIKYEFTSKLTDKDGNVIGDNDGTVMQINTMLTSLNAIQITYRGGQGNEATGLAFSNDVLPTGATVNNSDVLVTMVLDYSGSMDYPFDKTEVNGKKRIKALRESLEESIGLLSEQGMKLKLIPYSFVANGKHLYNNEDNYEKYADKVFDLSIKNEGKQDDPKTQAIKLAKDVLIPEGGTNTGDGLRLAYKGMKEYSDQITASGGNPKNVLILMNDGEISCASYKNFTIDRYDSYMSGSQWYYRYKGTGRTFCRVTNDNPTRVYGEAYGRDIYGRETVYMRLYSYDDASEKGNSVQYYQLVTRHNDDFMADVKYWGKKIADEFAITDAKGKKIPHTYYIAVSKDVSEGTKDEISTALGGAQSFTAENAEQLKKILKSIVGGIGADLWAFEGPSL